MNDIAGYDYGTSRAAHSPVTLEELRALEATIGWSDEDAAALRRAGEVLHDQAEALVDEWRGVIARQPHLVRWFFGPDGTPDARYRAAVKRRFVQWVTDACTRPHDQAWLDYQEEIGMRHTPAKKNKTDGTSTPSLVPLRYILAFLVPTILQAKPRLASKGHSADEVEAMHRAWLKSAVLHITLWSRPYIRDELW